MTNVPLEEYLRTDYEPDAEYVDGEIEERNVGEYDHNLVQLALVEWFRKRGREWGVCGPSRNRGLAWESPATGFRMYAFSLAIIPGQVFSTSRR